MLAREAVKDKDGNYIRSRQVNKRLKNDSDTVRKSINSAVCRLIENPETQAIGFYLRDTIKTGTRCILAERYTAELATLAARCRRGSSAESSGPSLLSRIYWRNLVL